MRSTKALCTSTNANRASTTTRSVVPCVPGPESVRILAPKHRPFGCRNTRTNGWLATQASSKGAPDPQKANITNPVKNLRTVTEIYVSQVTAARAQVTDNANPSKRALKRLRETLGRNCRERLHSRRHRDRLYRMGKQLATPSNAVALYARLLAHNRSRRRSLLNKDKV